VIRASWVLPIDRAPIRDGWIEIDRGRITSLGGGRPPAPAEDVGDVAVLPGLVNAHTHLELSWLAGRIPPASSLPEWIAQVLEARASTGGAEASERQDAMRRAAEGLRAAGTVLVGDVSNTLETPAVLAGAGLGGVVFHELIGFNAIAPRAIVDEARARRESLRPPVGGRVEITTVAHAPYSVAPALFTEIARRESRGPLSVHLAESPEEIEFLRSGTGPFRRLLERLGVWHDRWPVPGCDPVEFLDRVGYLRSDLLVVHGVHLTDAALARLARVGATLVTCPRSNEWVGAGLPRLAHIYGEGVRVAVGTDSLASAPTLNVFDELAEMRRVAPDVAASALLDSATRAGAEALGFGRDYGTIAPGKVAAFAAVAVPAGLDDVEEYLVGGVPAESVTALA
jgi:cytosine/adenosine deaminase-related metal-dependent hydrolase